MCTERWLRVALVLGLSVPSAGWAQAAGKKAGVAVEVEEITVTAQRREESLQETPISVTALSATTIAQKSLSTMNDIMASTPNVRISQSTFGTVSTAVTIRGLVQSNGEPAFAPKAGLYLDGAYIAQIKGSNFDLDDLERVELLRGPQGTLYGRNTITGALNFITPKPTEERSVTLSNAVGNYEAFNTRLTFNLPLIGKHGFLESDALGTLSLRETAGYKTHEGYYRNGLTASMPATPVPTGGADWFDQNRVYNFTSLRWQPTKDITVDYLFQFHRARQHGINEELTYVYPTNATVTNPKSPFYAIPYIQKNRSDIIPGTAPYQLDFPHTDQAREDTNERMHILTGAWDVGQVGPMGNVTLKSISSYRSNWIENTGERGVPFHILDTETPTDIQHWSEELQWVGTAPRVRYVGGLYYYGEYDMNLSKTTVFGGASRPHYRNFNRVKSYAAYGQGTWTPPLLSDKLSLTAGIRFTKEQVHLDHRFGKAVTPFSTAAALHMEGGKAFGGFEGAGAPGISPMVDISYQWTNELMTYFRASRGFTGGGFNPNTGGSPVLFRNFEPETLWSFEAGFKSEWLNRRLRVNADGFFSYYKDMQQTVFRPSPTGGAVSLVGNADRAELWGTEFEAVTVLFRGLEANATYSFLSPKYTKWNDIKFDANNQPVVDPITKQLVLESVADKREFSYAPRHQISGGITYTAPPTSVGVFSANLDASWQDKVTFIADDRAPGWQAVRAWSYALVNGRLSFAGIPLEKGSLDISVFSRNLLDRKYRVAGVDLGAGVGLALSEYGDPRTFGLQLTYNFSEL